MDCVFVSTFSRLDKNTVCHRRMFLERYLQQLCNSMYIGTSAVLRQFLDYESDLNEVTVSNMASQRVPLVIWLISITIHRTRLIFAI